MLKKQLILNKTEVMKYESPILRFSSLELVSDLLVDSYNVYSPQDPTTVTSEIVGTSGIETSQGYLGPDSGEKQFKW